MDRKRNHLAADVIVVLVAVKMNRQPGRMKIEKDDAVADVVVAEVVVVEIGKQWKTGRSEDR